MNSHSFYSAIVTAVILFTSSDSRASEIDELRTRVANLEERLASLEKTLQPLVMKAKAEQARSSQQVLARERMRQDSKSYTREELREVETLYQVANKNWGTQKAQDSLLTLVEKYDDANRTGCAILYLGQMSTGEEKTRYLTKAIEEFDSCFYGDGVQVGAYARFLIKQHCFCK